MKCLFPSAQQLEVYKMIVYKIYNDIDNKIYIGITIRTLNERWREHISRVSERTHCHLYAAMNKYGFCNFHIVQIDSAESKEELYEKEQYYIKLYDTQNPDNGYNMTSGGDALKSIDLDIDYIIFLYTTQNKSTEDIAKELKVSANTIRRRLLANGIKPNWGSSLKISKEDDKHILELREKGMSVVDIANLYNVSQSTIRGHLYKYGKN